MRITKVDIVNGTYALMRISGITTNPSPSEISMAIQVADDLAAQLEIKNIKLGWIQPSEYGASDPNDNSGLSAGLAGPFKKVLAIELLSYFGKQATDVLVIMSRDAMSTLEQYAVVVPKAQFDSTLPIGSGNEYDNSWGSVFYNTPLDSSAEVYIKGEVVTYNIDLSSFVIDEGLSSVVWDNSNDGIVIGNESYTDSIASAEIYFNVAGEYFICVTAAKTNSTEKKVIKKSFIVKEC